MKAKNKKSKKQNSVLSVHTVVYYLLILMEKNKID